MLNLGKRLNKPYLRDGRAPVPEREVTSRVMSAIKGKNTTPEVTLRRELWRIGVRGYRLHSKKIAGKPDICFPSKRLVVFVHGCFWHRCPHCQLPLPKTHSKFWIEKFEKNITRDEKIRQILTSDGWRILTVWECQIKNDVSKYSNEIKVILGEKSNETDN